MVLFSQYGSTSKQTTVGLDDCAGIPRGLPWPACFQSRFLFWNLGSTLDVIGADTLELRVGVLTEILRLIIVLLPVGNTRAWQKLLQRFVHALATAEASNAAQRIELVHDVITMERQERCQHGLTTRVATAIVGLREATLAAP